MFVMLYNTPWRLGVAQQVLENGLEIICQVIFLPLIIQAAAAFAAKY